jgi:hypothetical protein
MEEIGWDMPFNAFRRVSLSESNSSCFFLTVFLSYTYEVCLFDEARQKPGSGGGQTFSLG